MAEQTEVATTEAEKDQIVDPFETTEVPRGTLPIEDNPPAAEEKKEPVEEVKEEKPVETKPVEVAAEPTKAEIKYANEQSKKLHEALLAGKEDEVFSILQEKRTLSSVETLPVEDQIKLNLKYQHPEYSDEEIQGLFEESFSRPEKPEEKIDETQEEFEARMATWEKQNKRFENKLNREAKEARKNLAQKQSELVLPDISVQQTEAEPTAEEIAEQEKLQQSYLQSIDKGVVEFSGFSTSVKDGEVEIPISYSIPEDERTQLKTELQNFNVQEYFREQWMKDGKTFDGKQYAEDVYWLKNKEKILQKVASEAASQRLAKHLMEVKNIDFNGGGRQVAASAGHRDPMDAVREAAFSAQ